MIKKNTMLKGLIMTIGITLLVGCSGVKHSSNIDLNIIKQENQIRAYNVKVEDFNALLYL